MNKIIIIGNLTAEPEVTKTSNDLTVCKMTVAVNRKFAGANGDRGVDYLNVIAWRTLAENCAKFLSKGKKVAVVGSIQTRSYDDREGIKRYVTEIIAEEVEFLSPTENSGSERGYAPPERKQGQIKVEDLKADPDDENLPF